MVFWAIFLLLVSKNVCLFKDSFLHKNFYSFFFSNRMEILLMIKYLICKCFIIQIYLR